MGQGFKRKLYRLKWPAGHDLHGLEVTTKGLSVEKTFELASLGQVISTADGTEAQIGAYRQLCTEFAGRLVSWNLEEDDGTPVPATLEGVRDQDMGFMIGLITTWIDAVSSVDTPLPAASSNGHKPGPLESLPMEALSPSHQS